MQIMWHLKLMQRFAENSTFLGCDAVPLGRCTMILQQSGTADPMTQRHIPLDCIILKCICLTVPILSDTLRQFPPKFETWKLKQMSETHSCLTTVPMVQLSDPPRLLTATLSIPWSSWHSMAKKSPTVLLIGRRVNRQRSRRDGSGTVTWGRPLKYSTVTSVRTRTGLHLFTES